MTESHIIIILEELSRRNKLYPISLEEVPKEAVRNRDPKRIFDWLINLFSYQGVSDNIAEKHIEKYGQVTYDQIQRALENTAEKCNKLENFNSYKHCGYKKKKKTCNNQIMYKECPVPKHPLRKGSLNQSAYSLYFFIRDICKGDLVGFIDYCFDKHPDNILAMRDELISHLLNIHGVSYKIIDMAFSDLLVGADRTREGWMAVGATMVAIDTLVHNFLHRTGILKYYHMLHKYDGIKCHSINGCVEAINNISKLIDCRQFNPSYPKFFPRFVQNSIWRYCSTKFGNICNGNVIDDSYACDNNNCSFYNICDKIPLKGPA